MGEQAASHAETPRSGELSAVPASTGRANGSPKSRAKRQRSQARSPGGEAGQCQAEGSWACGLGAHPLPFLRGLRPQRRCLVPREPHPGLGRLPAGRGWVSCPTGCRRGGRGSQGPCPAPAKATGTPGLLAKLQKPARQEQFFQKATRLLHSRCPGLGGPVGSAVSVGPHP